MERSVESLSPLEQVEWGSRLLSPFTFVFWIAHVALNLVVGLYLVWRNWHSLSSFACSMMFLGAVFMFKGYQLVFNRWMQAKDMLKEMSYGDSHADPSAARTVQGAFDLVLSSGFLSLAIFISLVLLSRYLK
jgi:hypothetical protein